MENLGGPEFHGRGEDPLSIQELAKRAKITLSLITDQLPETEKELDRLTSPEERAWFKLKFLGKVANSSDIHEYLTRTREEIEIVNFGLLRRIQYFNLLLGGVVNPRSAMRSVNVALIINSDGLEIKGVMFLNPIDVESNFRLFQTKHPKDVRTIEELDLSRCLSKIEAAIR